MFNKYQSIEDMLEGVGNAPTYMFVPIARTAVGWTYHVYTDSTEGLHVCGMLHTDLNNQVTVTDLINPSEGSADAVKQLFSEWKTSSIESTLIWSHNIQDLSVAEAIGYYVYLMVACAMLRALPTKKSYAEVLQYARRFHSALMKYLYTTDFFVAPASTVYHEAYEHGLLEHSLNVALNVLELWAIPHFSSVKIADAMQAALVHDWCKIGIYEQYLKNVKNEETGVWEKVPSYKRVDPANPMGHGVDSMFKGTRICNFTTQQALAVRWHMGAYNVASNESWELCAANERYPMVHMLQFADQMACMDIQKSLKGGMKK